jgi:indole-3-acetate monooxygenase
MVLINDVTDLFESVLTAARHHAADGEERRALAPETVTAARESGLFCMALPSAFGGLELPPPVIVDVLERLAHADGAAGWCGFIGNATSFCGWLEPTIARKFLGAAPNVAAASVFAPTGRAVPAGDHFVVDGRWSFASGCTHSELFQVGVLVMGDRGPRQRSDGSPDWRFAYVSAADVEIIDTWDTLGLRGTGSHDIAVHGANVPEELLAMPLFDAPKCDDALFRFGFFGILPIFMGPFPIGLARRALDELEAFLPTKAAMPGRPAIGADPQVHYELGRARASLSAARAYLDDAVGAAWDTISGGAALSDDERDALGVAMQHAMTTALDVVQMAYRFAGSGAVYRGNVIQRCFRDLHTADKHLAFSLEGYRGAGRHALGLA